METSFSDGCYLIMLIGQLDGYFVPHYSYYIPGRSHIYKIAWLYYILADTNEKKLKNVELALDLISEAGCKMPKVRASDIVQQDTKSTLRLIYAIYEKFCKGVSSPAWRFLWFSEILDLHLFLKIAWFFKKINSTARAFFYCSLNPKCSFPNKTK